MTVTSEALARARPISPYKGLASFEDSELDALLFFGREREREIVAANLVAARLTILYGTSGVGKSSLLKAAVARDLRYVAHWTPALDLRILLRTLRAALSDAAPRSPTARSCRPSTAPSSAWSQHRCSARSSARCC